MAGQGPHHVRLARRHLVRTALHGMELAQQRAEQLELVRVAHRPVRLLGLHLGQEQLDPVGIAGDFGQAGEPRLQLGVIVAQAVDRLSQLDGTPDPELVEVIVGLGPLEVVQRGLRLAAVVQHVGQVDPRLGEGRLQLQRAAQVEERSGVVPQAVTRVAQAGGGVGRLRLGRRRKIEEPLRRAYQALAEERAPDLQHQFVVFLEPEQHDPLEGAQRPAPLPQFEQHFAQSRQPVLVIGIERQRPFEAPAGPGVFLPREVGVCRPDVELDGEGIKGDALLQKGQGIVVSTFIVQLVGLFVEIVRAAERIRHQARPPGLFQQLYGRDDAGAMGEKRREWA